jgi:hypothetical protein
VPPIFDRPAGRQGSRPNQHAVDASSKTWLAIKSRIEADVDADVSDLLIS